MSGESGEKPGLRQAMEQQTSRLREAGVPPAEAERIARETARRLDRKIESGAVKIPVR